MPLIFFSLSESPDSAVYQFSLVQNVRSPDGSMQPLYTLPLALIQGPDTNQGAGVNLLVTCEYKLFHTHEK